MRSVLVIGGAGYVGSHVCKALRSARIVPVAYDNLSTGHRGAVQWGPLEVGDAGDADRLAHVLQRYRPDAVMHFASFIAAGESMKEPASYYDNNVVRTLTLLDEMLRHDVRRFVFSSSAAVYGDPQYLPIDEDHPLSPVNPYGNTKEICERILCDYHRAYGLDSVSLRYFNAAGADPGGTIGEAHEPETHLIPLVLGVASGDRPHVSVFGDEYGTEDGTCVRDYVHVCDLASAHVLAVERLRSVEGALAFNLGTGEAHSVLQVVAAARRVTDAPIPVRIEEPRPGDPPILCADASRAQRELGWRPIHTTLDSQIRDAWNWHRRLAPGEARNRRFAAAAHTGPAEEPIGQSTS